jgi:copper(I)-binding protein
VVTKRSLLTIGATAVLLLGACGDGNDGGTSSSVDSGSPDSTQSADDAAVTIEGAWARTSPAGVDKGAAYMVITSARDDRLLGASVPDDIATDAQIHEMVMAGSDDMSDDDMSDDDMTSSTMSSDDDMYGDDDDDDMSSSTMTGSTMAPSMVMQEVQSIELLAGTPLALKPGGFHVMLVGLTAPFEVGQTFVVTLMFERAGAVDVTVVVADEEPMS